MKTVLVAEDEPLVRDMLEEFISGLGHEIHVAMDGLKAIAIILHAEPAIDVLVTDRQMPGGPLGEEVIRTFKAANPKGKALLMTGNMSKTVEEVARAAGADEVWSKPFDLDKLERFISEP